MKIVRRFSVESVTPADIDLTIQSLAMEDLYGVLGIGAGALNDKLLALLEQHPLIASLAPKTKLRVVVAIAPCKRTPAQQSFITSALLSTR